MRLHIVHVNVFDAIAHPTRRHLLGRLRAGGPANLGALAKGLPMSRQAVTKHLDVLTDAGLVRVRRSGRDRLHELDPSPLRELDDWLAPYAAEWDRRLERLKRHVEKPR